MPTFSEIVDSVAETAGIKNNIPAAVGYVNRAIKRLTPMHHYSDLVELRFPVERHARQHAFLLPTNHRTTRVVRIDGHKYAKRKLPGLVQAVTTDASHFYYEAGIHIHIAGPAHRYIDMAYYRVTPSLLYYHEEYRLMRAALQESNNPYEYRDAATNDWFPINLNLPAHAASYQRHTNWITNGYAETLTNGALSHAFNAKGETERGSRLFQLFNADVKELEKAHQDLMVGQQ